MPIIPLSPKTRPFIIHEVPKENNASASNIKVEYETWKAANTGISIMKDNIK